MDTKPDADTGGASIALEPDVAIAILRTIHAGWLSVSTVTPADDEVKITEQLRAAMRRVVNEHANTWDEGMVILRGTESLSRPSLDRPDGRTDMSILLLGMFNDLKDHDPHAIIECKRVAGGNTGLCWKYVHDGIDRFRTGKYGGRHATGFMIGYVLSARALDAAHGINRCLSGKGRHSELLHGSPLLDKCWAWSSCHPREPPSKSPIILEHAFLEF